MTSAYNLTSATIRSISRPMESTSSPLAAPAICNTRTWKQARHFSIGMLSGLAFGWRCCPAAGSMEVPKHCAISATPSATGSIRGRPRNCSRNFTIPWPFKPSSIDTMQCRKVAENRTAGPAVPPYPKNSKKLGVLVGLDRRASRFCLLKTGAQESSIHRDQRGGANHPVSFPRSAVYTSIRSAKRGTIFPALATSFIPHTPAASGKSSSGSSSFLLSPRAPARRAARTFPRDSSRPIRGLFSISAPCCR
jgi:hypothetical protein